MKRIPFPKGLSTMLVSLAFMAIPMLNASAQSVSHQIPPSFNHTLSLETIEPTFVYPNKVFNYDLALQNHKNGAPLEAGFTVETHINSWSSGSMLKWPNGTKSWILRLISPGAPALGINLENLDLPAEGAFFIYTPDREHLVKLSKNDLVAGILSSPIFPGESIVVEYSENRKDISTNSISLAGSFTINELVIIYNGLESVFGAKELGDSDPCEVNVNCSPEGDNWKKQKRGVARILLKEGSGWYWCTGTLINTTAQDGTPYFLTADHCGGSASASDRTFWKFYFNYERPGCPNTGTPPNNLITGCTLKARGLLSGGSDFQLLLLSSTPQSSWNPYYNGWDRSTTGATSGVGIHHPSGDAKKISTYVSTLTSATPNISGSIMASNSAWRVTWIATTNGHGVTEGGSSGSPIFNSSGLVVGTLSGGSSTCSSPTSPDFYGKFDYHWLSNGTSESSQLMPWLDPQGTNPTVLSGWEPNAQPYANFSANTTTVYIGNPVTFTDLSGGGSITSWSWNFGEGASPASATTQGPHDVIYSTPGAKTVSLTVNSSYTSTKENYITVLDSPFIPPSNLAGEAVNESSIKIIWDAPQLVLEEGFEKYDDFVLSFEPWVQHDGDGSGTYGIQNTEFTNSGYTGSFIVFNPAQTNPALGSAWTPKTGEKYAACFSATSPPNNDWLITPLIKVQAGFTFKFWAKSVTSQWGLERFKVGVSAGGITPASFTIISAGNYLQAPTAWTEYAVDLSSYEGQWIRLAINCVSDDAFALLIDDVSITDSEGRKVFHTSFTGEKPNKSTRNTSKSTAQENSPKEMLELAGYRVYRDGEAIIDIDDPDVLEYLDEDLDLGTYSYRVSALYSSPQGESALSESVEVVLEPAGSITFTVTDGTYPIEGAVISIEGIGVDLITDSNGMASKNLVDGTYNFSVFAVYFEEYNDSFTIAGEPQSLDVTMIPVTTDLYTITFTVTSNETPVTNASISIIGLAGSITTNEDGEATIDLPDGEYSYNATAELHYPKSGTLTVAGSAQTVEIEITLFPSVNFYVFNSGASPIQGAVIDIDGVDNDLTTDTEGMASIILADGTYSFTVSATGFVTHSAQFTLSGSDIDIDIELSLNKYPVTFTVKNINQSPMQGVTITLLDLDESLVTNALGQAMFTLENGTYDYTVNKENYFEVEGDFTVSGAPKSVNVTIIGVSTPYNNRKTVKVFPNPFDNSIRFTSEKPVERIEITNLIGQKVLSMPFTSDDSNEITTSSLPSGIYVITFRFLDGEVVNQRIVKK